MKNFKADPVKTLILTIFLTLPLTAFSQYTLTDDDVTVDENGVITECSYDFTETDIIIPETLDGRTVTGIGGGMYDAPFGNQGLTSVILPATLTDIGSYALYYNSLSSIELPSNLINIGLRAFSHNELSSVELPASVTFIGAQAFAENDEISSGDIILPESPTNEYTHWINYNGNIVTSIEPSYLSYAAYIEHTLTDEDVVVEDGIITSSSYSFRSKFITIPETLDRQTVTGIFGDGDDYEAFGPFTNQNIWEISIPASVEIIQNRAFFNNDLYSVTFENNSQLKKIGTSSFSENFGLSFQLPTSARPDFEGWIRADGTEYTEGEVISYSDMEIMAKLPYTLTDADVTVENGVITGCSYDYESKFITIPDELDNQTITEIGVININGIFSHKGIMELTLPTTLEKIGRAAFAQNWLKSINLERCPNLSHIGTNAFYSNDLTELHIPASVTTIEEKAFSYNMQIENLTIAPGSQLNYIGPNAFLAVELVLPAPIKSGEYFVTWEDGNGDTYHAGTTITDFSSDFTAVFSDTPTSLADALKIDLEIYPNPVQRILNINSDQLVQIEIIDLSGTVIYKSESQNTSIDFSPFANGIYFLTATNSQGIVEIKKIVKN